MLSCDSTVAKLAVLGEEARLWLFTDNEGFLRTCEGLGLHPQVVRSHILELTPDEARALRGLEFGDASRVTPPVGAA